MKSLWTNKIDMPSFEKLNKDVKTDVLIIGGGITGILTAYRLHQKGIPYILVEKNKICSGTTMNTTAKITCQHGLIYHKILKNYGTEYTKMYLESNKIALAEYIKLCKNIDCDFELQDNYVYSKSDYYKLSEEMKALERIGYNAEFVQALHLPLSVTGAICFKNQAQFHPIKFLRHIASGLNIYENTFIKKLEGNTAITELGKIYADKIIIATHYPFINKHGSYFLKLHQHRSYVIAIEKAQKVNGMYVDEDKKGLSFRNYRDLLLLGGGSHRTGENGGNWAELRLFAKEKYPHSNEVYHWATQDCMSLDDIPYIGNYSRNTPNLYVASGFNKWGMTGAMTSAMILSDMVTDVKNDYSSIFNPSRNIAGIQFLVNGGKTVKNLLKPTKPRCSHMGCALKWNKAEQSWDCPCHGSRFSENGEILDNPANKNATLH